MKHAMVGGCSFSRCKFGSMMNFTHPCREFCQHPPVVKPGKDLVMNDLIADHFDQIAGQSGSIEVMKFLIQNVRWSLCAEDLVDYHEKLAGRLHTLDDSLSKTFTSHFIMEALSPVTKP